MAPMVSYAADVQIADAEAPRFYALDAARAGIPSAKYASSGHPGLRSDGALRASGLRSDSGAMANGFFRLDRSTTRPIAAARPMVIRPTDAAAYAHRTSPMIVTGQPPAAATAAIAPAATSRETPMAPAAVSGTSASPILSLFDAPGTSPTSFRATLLNGAPTGVASAPTYRAPLPPHLMQQSFRSEKMIVVNEK